MAIGPVSIGIVIMLALSRHLNILVLGETEAKAVGMSVCHLEWVCCLWRQ